MKFLGHPIHMMLIHFPSALFPMDFVCSVIAHFTGNNSFTDAAFFAMCGGVLLGFAAIVTGAVDLLGVVNKQPDAVKRTLLHGGINSTVVIAYSVIAFMAYSQYPSLQPDSLAMIIGKGALVAFLLGGNYLGGNLVLKDRIGIVK
jgi:uncharacterized membrane protein